jgi:hypothetical protein
VGILSRPSELRAFANGRGLLHITARLRIDTFVSLIFGATDLRAASQGGCIANGVYLDVMFPIRSIAVVQSRALHAQVVHESAAEAVEILHHQSSRFFDDLRPEL